MPKRKRSAPSLQETVEKSETDVARALKTAKGFERQRYSKKIHHESTAKDKKIRLEREIAVLKSLDLHQTARAHLFSSLLKVKSIAASTDLPEYVRRGMPKPDVSPEEKAAIHNVTSGLYNQESVRQAVDTAITAVCGSLNIPAPGKNIGEKRRKKETPREDSEKVEGSTSAGIAQHQEDEDGISDFEGFESDLDVPGSTTKTDDGKPMAGEETEISQYDHLIAGVTDSEGEEDEERSEIDFSSDKFKRFKGKEEVNLDDISVSGSDDILSGEEADINTPVRSSASESPEPPPSRKALKDDKRIKTETKISRSKVNTPITSSTFLPSLMGGYISGSESASDVDVAPAKKRLGQKQRQAIWEKKFGRQAKHLQNQPKSKTRDSGWDMRKGAVDGADKGATPWKQGMGNPLARRGNGDAGGQRGTSSNAEPVRAKDNAGKLHPSWEARKKAKDSEKQVAFTGSKVVFD